MSLVFPALFFCRMADFISRGVRLSKDSFQDMHMPYYRRAMLSNIMRQKV